MAKTELGKKITKIITQAEKTVLEAQKALEALKQLKDAADDFRKE